jgi:hypothetical protein
MEKMGTQFMGHIAENGCTRAQLRKPRDILLSRSAISTDDVASGNLVVCRDNDALARSPFLLPARLKRCQYRLGDRRATGDSNTVSAVIPNKMPRW